MRFLHPELLWLLTLLPVLALLRGRRGAAPALLFSTTAIAATLASARKYQPGKLLASLKLLVIACLILALARPQLGNTTTEIEASGIDIMLAVDVSGSMEAMDFTLQGKTANRLQVVKAVVADFIADRPNDRIGLLAFSVRPYLISPLTLDHHWLQKRLEALTVGMIEDGTAIGSAIGVGVSRLHEQESKSRILILLTDGMNNAGKVPPAAAAEAARTLEIKVYTIGAGTRGVARTPVVDPYGRKVLANVRVDIDERSLQQIAALTGARYYRATDTASLERIYQEINAMETTTRTSKHFEHYRELYPLLIVVALLLLAGELLLRRRFLP
ncbi:VWA domain-containing protein [Desulfofustis glycolicus]|uniref:Ca-activated chloride channel family protein n=1 Tax=Desulfofustis glycolicus DSM 9705 TaxID=1121409 RepID=A0A1M5WJ63_9BACT|nr:VWA domain-containing protein [Desulfofustis glycolicus]MCB2216818.1 VWA domain-containing protein [Desulfobulbaceae bacterium]SHH87467.1 Ca-activated chloride channel family protein [Desulfofustis glycolicus DSM 9705]